MSQINLLDNWETQYDEPQISRLNQDEVISVYEVYVKEETIGPDGKTQVSVVSSIPGPGQHQLIEGDLDLDAVIESDIINVDGSVSKLFGNDALKYKIMDQNVAPGDDNLVVYSHPLGEGPSTGTARLIDKDDPRSRLHFVKYLKRDGKTLKIWECGICSKEFRHQYTLMRHLPTHTDERNFKCEACGKAFRQLSTLSQHKAIHSDARPYVCEFCKKTFNRVSTLISHRKTHSEQKPHKCHLCGKGFHQKGNLRNHVFTHTNERPYKCELCGKGFNQMSNLVCHKVKAHAHVEKMQYVCGICDKEFPRRFSLRAHEELKHGIKYRNPAAVEPTTSEANIKRKGARIIDLPDDERNVITDVKEKDILHSPPNMDAIIIDKIDTKAMETALIQRQTPFALYKPAKGIPVLVRVSSIENSKHILTPATAEDLRSTGNMALSSEDSAKSVQVKVPVVATIIQKLESSGKYSYSVEPPGPEQEQESLITPLDSTLYPEKNTGNTSISSPEDCNELLELAAQGGIQFVRATADGRYEVMTNNEARDLMAQNSHDVTILDGEEAINLVNSHQSIPEMMERMEESIEFLGDKEIRVLESSKDLDDRYGDISLYSQSKIDEILGSKFDETIAIERDDEGLGMGTSRLDLSSFLNHRTEIPTITSSHASIASLLNKTQHPISILNESLPYLKNQSLSDDLNLLGIPGPDDRHSIQEYTKLKIPGFDDCEPATSLNSIQPDLKVLNSRCQNGINNPRQKNQKLISSLGEVKILGPKNPTPEMIMQYQDLKFLNSYEQFLKNSHLGAMADYHEEKKEVKVLGKKPESGIFINLDDPTKKSRSNNSSCSSSGYESTKYMISPEKENRIPVARNDPDNFLAQASSSCGSDFLNFDSRVFGSPSSQFERALKEKDLPMNELPSLD
ncbi:uncharacterized protein LOC117168494 isoform X2 [Belonocnema kinseyi]|uniref:uncharacterized protein LOC117168494 isoform X2 n=1 Tax=Belonocnema kinseyi TaxID=2817044 RepID=UPI00143D12C7|nr:uncharacterized protein LOC117168494 isoform X2 [Belonocnema kinseyi]